MAGATANGCASGLSASGMTAQFSLDEGLIANETPDDAALADCKALGAKLAE